MYSSTDLADKVQLNGSPTTKKTIATWVKVIKQYYSEHLIQAGSGRMVRYTELCLEKLKEIATYKESGAGIAAWETRQASVKPPIKEVETNLSEGNSNNVLDVDYEDTVTNPSSGMVLYEEASYQVAPEEVTDIVLRVNKFDLSLYDQQNENLDSSLENLVSQIFNACDELGERDADLVIRQASNRRKKATHRKLATVAHQISNDKGVTK